MMKIKPMMAKAGSINAIPPGAYRGVGTGFSSFSAREVAFA